MMSDFDVLADPRFDEGGWLRENFEKLSDKEILSALVQIAGEVQTSCGHTLYLGADLGSETREMLVDALVSMSNVDW